jgi:hypothetical protein
MGADPGPHSDSKNTYLNSQSVVVKVAEAVGLALEEFHLGVKALVIPLLRVKRHMRAISSIQEEKVAPRVSKAANPEWRSW